MVGFYCNEKRFFSFLSQTKLRSDCEDELALLRGVADKGNIELLVRQQAVHWVC
jgi:hypothetical protein